MPETPAPSEQASAPSQGPDSQTAATATISDTVCHILIGLALLWCLCQWGFFCVVAEDTWSSNSPAMGFTVIRPIVVALDWLISLAFVAGFFAMRLAKGKRVLIGLALAFAYFGVTLLFLAWSNSVRSCLTFYGGTAHPWQERLFLIRFTALPLLLLWLLWKHKGQLAAHFKAPMPSES